MIAWDEDFSQLGPSSFCTGGVMGGMESLQHSHPSMMSGHRYV
jgi:hypothetical protein